MVFPKHTAVVLLLALVSRTVCGARQVPETEDATYDPVPYARERIEEILATFASSLEEGDIDTALESLTPSIRFDPPEADTIVGKGPELVAALKSIELYGPVTMGDLTTYSCEKTDSTKNKDNQWVLFSSQKFGTHKRSLIFWKWFPKRNPFGGPPDGNLKIDWITWNSDEAPKQNMQGSQGPQTPSSQLAKETPVHLAIKQRWQSFVAALSQQDISTLLDFFSSDAEVYYEGMGDILGKGDDLTEFLQFAAALNQTYNIEQQEVVLLHGNKTLADEEVDYFVLENDLITSFNNQGNLAGTGKQWILWDLQKARPGEVESVALGDGSKGVLRISYWLHNTSGKSSAPKAEAPRASQVAPASREFEPSFMSIIAE